MRDATDLEKWAGDWLKDTPEKVEMRMTHGMLEASKNAYGDISDYILTNTTQESLLSFLDDKIKTCDKNIELLFGAIN